MTSNSSAKLQMENKDMENRLQILKQMMSAEKARREIDGGIHWESGRPGPLRAGVKNSSLSSFPTYHKALAKANSKKPIKVTFLSKNSTRAEGKPGEKPVLQCGQCEVSSAMLTCMECIENYCQLCFAKMHQKGGLAKHHVKPILRKVKPILDKTTGDATTGNASVETHSTTKRIGEQRSLLDGTYDQATSAASFQEALTEWRSGNKAVLSKHCNTSLEDAELNAKVSTTTGTVQVGEGSLMQQRFQNDIIFPDTNSVTYFEKILIRRHKESLLMPSMKQSLSRRPLIVTQEDGVEESEEKESPFSMISEYNIFYDDDDVVLADTDNASLADFNRIRHCTGVVIEDMLTNGDKIDSHESNSHKHKSDLGVRLKKTIPRLKEKGKRRKQHGMSIKNSNEQLGQADLVTAVQSAWLSCTRGNVPNQLLANFFLHAVRPANNSEENAVKPSHLSETSASGQSAFSSRCKTWVPTDSIAREKELYNNVEDVSLSPDQTPRECRDSYYTDSTSDSEPENEQEPFLGSRLGTVHKSAESDRGSRLSSSYDDLEREEDMERDKADSDALKNLVCELQVSSGLDGLLLAWNSRTGTQDLDDEEGEIMDEGLLEDDVGDVDMMTSWTPSREYFDQVSD